LERKGKKIKIAQELSSVNKLIIVIINIGHKAK